MLSTHHFKTESVTIETRPLIRECLKLLNVCGLNPANQNKWSKFRAIGTLILLTHVTSGILLEILFNEKGWQQMEAIAVCVGFILGLYKIAYCAMQRKRLVRILNDFKQFFIFNSFEIHFQQSIRAALQSAVQVVKFFFGMALFALFAFLVKPLLMSAEDSRIPFDVYLPSNIHPSSYYYYIMYVVQVVDGVVIFCGMLGFDCLFMAFVIHITCELKILKQKLFSIDVNVNSSRDDENCLTEINKLVDHHNLILRCIKHLNQLYAPVLLVQFSISVVLICVGLFFLAVNGFPPPVAEVGQFVPFLIATSMQLFIYCLGGTYLINETESVAQAIYDSDWWVKTQPKFRRVCLLIIQRANRAECLTAGGMFILNLESFTKIIKFALSFFSMARATYRKDETD